MTNTCPACGISLEDDPKYCPGCGALLNTAVSGEQSDASADDAENTGSEQKPSEERVFILREKSYGDTAEYDNSHEEKDKPSDEPPKAAKLHLSLYLSVAALALSLVAVVLVIFFAVIPANERAENAEPTAPTSAVPAPTQPPTEPPITGSYSLVEIEGEKTGFTVLLLKNTSLEMRSDYTGSLTIGGNEIGKLSLEKGGNSGEFLNLDCAYTFDGKVLTIDYIGLTLVYKKNG